MKTFINVIAFLATISFASNAFAGTLKPKFKAYPVNVVSVSKRAEFRGKYPVGHVSVVASFSSSCHVPLSNELVEVANYNMEENKLNITLAVIPSGRVCLGLFKPVKVTIQLEDVTMPVEIGLPEVSVNGVFE